MFWVIGKKVSFEVLGFQEMLLAHFSAKATVSAGLKKWSNFMCLSSCRNVVRFWVSEREEFI